MFQNKHKCTVYNTLFENVHGCKSKFTLSQEPALLRSDLDTEVNRDRVRSDAEKISVETGWTVFNGRSHKSERCGFVF